MADLLIPVKRQQRGSGTFSVPKEAVLSSIHREDHLPLNELRSELERHRIRGKIRWGARDATFSIRRDRSLTHPEAYELMITPSEAVIRASGPAGAYYGVQTLRQMLRLHGARLPCGRTEDWPTFSRRGIYHDCSRGKVPKVATVKALVERLAHWKINELQLYVENVFTFQSHPDIGRGYSPFKPDDLLEIQGHCRRYHIRFVPSLTSFGHFEKILMLPRYAALGELPGFHGFPGGTTLCPADPRAIRLVADMYDDFVPLFEAEDFNICGDEPWELGRGRSKRRAKRIGVGRVYLDFLLKLRDLCVKHGRRMNVWADIVLKYPEMLSDLPRDVVMLNWDYRADGSRLARTAEIPEAGLPLVCCPGTGGWLSHGSRLDTALANISQFARIGFENNAEGLLTTDWGDVGHRNSLGASLCAMSHGAAHGWNPEGVDDSRHLRNFTFQSFADRTGQLARALKIIGDAAFGFWAYRVLLESLIEPRELGKNFARALDLGKAGIDDVSLSLPTIRARLRAAEEFEVPRPDVPLPPFEALCLREFALANDMNRLALRRLELGRRVRRGRMPPATELRTHAGQMNRLGERFAEIWRERNRPSRLKDNTAGFKAAVAEARAIAGKRG